MNTKREATSIARALLVLLGIYFLIVNTAYAAVSYSQSVTLEPGWNIVSTPRILESHSFSAPETLANFSIYTLDPSRPSGWATLAELGQTEFTPLYGYFINNKGTTTQTLTLNYKASTTPNEQLFARQFTREGWYAVGVANPSYAKEQGSSTADSNNPNHVLNSLLSATSNYSSVVDFTDAVFASNPDSVSVNGPWKLVARSSDPSNIAEINSLNDFRETKGYAIYIKQNTTLTGFQNTDTPQCTDGIDNDGDGKIDYLTDFGCFSNTDNSESNPPAGSFVVTKSTTYANQTVTIPQSAYKIGEYSLTLGSGDDYILSVLGLGINSSSTSLLSNIYIEYAGTTTQVVTSGKNELFWLSAFPVSGGANLPIKIYATLPTTMISGDTITTQLILGGVSLNSGDIVTSQENVFGQTITIATGSLTAALDASTPVSSLVVANSMPKVASYKFTASNDSYTITELTTTIADSSSVIELVFKDGATEIGRQTFSGTVATKTGLSIAIPSNANKVIDIYANLGAIGTGFGATGGNVGVSLIGYEKQSSNGIKTFVNTNGLAGNSMYAYKTKPTITNVALPNSVLNVGTMTVAKFTITADAGGTVAWRKLILNVASSTPSGVIAVNNWAIYDSANESTPLSGVVVTSTGSTVTFTSTAQDQEISGSKTYVVKASFAGSGLVTGASHTASILPTSGLGYAAPAAYATVTATTATFIWSDEAVIGHDATTLDWNNDYLVKNIPTDSQTLTK